jgi:probable rRNA maturation factor
MKKAIPDIDPFSKEALDIEINIEDKIGFAVSFCLESYIKKVILEKNIKTGHFEFNFISNKTIVEINKKHLQREYQTDIISFNIGSTTHIIGDVYISVEQAQTNATEFDNNFEEEIKLLIIHGILHLLDYRDYTEAEQEIMEKEQARILKLI